MDRAALGACATGDLIDTAGRLNALLSATHATLLEVLAELDRRDVRVTDACGSMVDWTSFRLGVTRRTAHEWVDAARRLAEFPRIAAAFGDGRLSWDKTKAVATMAEELAARNADRRDPAAEIGDTKEPDKAPAAEIDGGSASAAEIDEDALIDEALASDAGRLEAAARRARKVSLLDAQRRERQRFLSLRRCRDDGGLRLSGFLPDADGEVVAKAIETIAGRAEKDPDTGLYTSYDRRCADALVEMASDALSRAQAERGDRAMVVAHVDVTALAEGAAALRNSKARCRSQPKRPSALHAIPRSNIPSR